MRYTIICAVFLLQSCAGNTPGHTSALPVIVLPYDSSIRNNRDVKNYKYPAYDTIVDTGEFKGKVAIYGASGRLWIGPSGWTARGSIDSEGTVTVKLYPPGRREASGPRIEFTEMPTG